MGLDDRIDNTTARVCVIGLGYVGLPLTVEMARVGFDVVGLETDARKVETINAGGSYIDDVRTEDVAEQVSLGNLVATTDYDVLDSADVIFICVPTPFDEMKAPDLSFIIAAAEGIATRLRKDQLIILQSTTYPGTTEEVVLPLLSRTGMTGGEDFFLAFSPERINPGDRVHSVANTPKVVGGLTTRCAELAGKILSRLTQDVRVVSTPRAAEMTKLLENIFRSVNIALVNELALLSERMGIDIWEVIEAASTKPFGFMPFHPGPGTGGHCIPVDPYYLSWKAREYDFYTKFIELAAEVNQDMPYHVVDLIGKGLNRQGKNLQGAHILILGVAFKRNVDDARNSPARRIIELLVRRGAEVTYNDPHVPRFDVGGDAFCRERTRLESHPLSHDLLARQDCVVILADHASYDYAEIVQRASLIVDTRNATRDLPGSERVLRVGAPLPEVPSQRG